MKKLVIAMDSFKESLSANEACATIAKAFSDIYNDSLEIISVPMADGGEGTLDALVSATSGKLINIKVKNPLGEEIESSYGLLGDKKTAVIEMARASGLMLIKPEERNPLLTTTYGTGQLVLDAIKQGYTNIILAIGGSATNDGGSGMLEALGAKFINNEGKEFSPVGGNLSNLSSINIDNLQATIKGINFIVACDVDNPLTGERGASAIFGPQKGATPDMVKQLDFNLFHFAKITNQTIGSDKSMSAGAGAAGGMGFASLSYLNANFKRGIDMVIEASNLAKKIIGSSLVITGEGQIDSQTIFGKTPMGVAKVANEAGAKTIALVGSIGNNYQEVYKIGIEAVFSILSSPTTLENALKNAKNNLYQTSYDLAKLIKLSRIL